MTDSPRVPPTQVTGVYGGVLKLAMRKMLGKVPVSVGVMWHHPRVFKALMGLGRRSERWHELDPGLSALAAMATASRIGCAFCLDLHYFLTHHQGLDEAKAREVPRWRESEAFTPLERRVMEYAEAMSQTPPSVTDDLSAALLADLGAPALLELTAKVGLMNLSARTNVALGIGSEMFSEACGLPPLAAPSRVASRP